MTSSIPPSNIQIIDSRGYCSPSWYRWFTRTDNALTGAGAGEVVATGGLAGGGTLADGVTIAIADNGVTDDKIRIAGHTSVIGRAGPTGGNVADIAADGDNRILGREGGILAFRAAPTVDALTALTALTSPIVNVTTLKFSGAAVAAAAVPSTHKIAVMIGGVAYFLLATT